MGLTPDKFPEEYETYDGRGIVLLNEKQDGMAREYLKRKDSSM